MPRPLRKSFQRPTADEARGFSINLSRVAVAALALVLLAVVGWTFFMGFMVGRGQNPEKRVEQMTGMAHEEPAPQTAAHIPAHIPADIPAGQAAMPPAESSAPQQPAGQPPASAAGPERAEAPAQTGQAAPQNAPAYPFSRPQGEGLAAWGIRPEANTPAPETNAAAPGQGQGAPTPAARPRAPQKTPRAEALFDYTYQAAAFRDKADADKLRARLEGKGLRTRQQKSGKVLLVLVPLRGTEADAANLREELQRMKLGKPILLSKKAVSGKPRKAAR